MSNLYEQLQATLGDAYRLERELGGGGMSRVFLAHEIALGRRVVVKVLLPELAAGVSVDRFRREIQLAAQLQHPHIVPLLSAGESQGLPYFTMPYIDGESLGVKLARTGELPVAETVRILRDVASALAYAHEKGIMHRDVKPGNVLLSGGVAVVTDFGVAKAVSASSGVSETRLTSLGVALGTPAYMAPEQASGDPQVDHRADIYALGIMTYEMLAGRTPFWGRATTAVLAAHVVEAPEPIDRLRPGVPPMLATLVMQSLAKRPADRPQSANEVMRVVDAISTPSGGTTPTTVVIAHPTAAARRSRAALMWAAAVGLVVAGGILWRRNAFRSSPAPQPPVVAEAAKAPAAVDSMPAPQNAVPPPPREERQAPSAVEAPPAAPPKSRRRPAAHPARPAPPSTQPNDAGAAPRPGPVVSAAPESAAPAPPAPAESSVPHPPPPVETKPPPAIPTPAVSPARPDPGVEIRDVVAAYASAIESQSVDNIRRVYPGITPSQQRGWEQFFQTVRDVKAQLSIAQLDVADATAEAQVTGSYTYLNRSTRDTERLPIAFHASLRRDANGWRITQVR